MSITIAQWNGTLHLQGTAMADGEIIAISPAHQVALVHRSHPTWEDRAYAVYSLRLMADDEARMGSANVYDLTEASAWARFAERTPIGDVTE